MNLADLVAPGDLCLDIGSGAGTPELAALVGPRGAVHAFVPRPGARARLRLRTVAHRQVRIVAATVGGDDDPWRAVRSVDGWCRSRRRVALLRVDAAAPAVLTGATRVLRRDRPMWLIEVAPRLLERDGHRIADVTGPLGRAGYVMLTWRGGWRPTDTAAGPCLFLPRVTP